MCPWPSEWHIVIYRPSEHGFLHLNIGISPSNTETLGELCDEALENTIMKHLHGRETPFAAFLSLLPVSPSCQQTYCIFSWNKKVEWDRHITETSQLEFVILQLPFVTHENSADNCHLKIHFLSFKWTQWLLPCLLYSIAKRLKWTNKLEASFVGIMS